MKDSVDEMKQPTLGAGWKKRSGVTSYDTDDITPLTDEVNRIADTAKFLDVKT